MSASNRITPQTAGIFLAIASTIIFSVQDGISKYLAQNYDVICGHVPLLGICRFVFA